LIHVPKATLAIVVDFPALAHPSKPIFIGLQTFADFTNSPLFANGFLFVSMISPFFG
jgi:hypothetical protein